MFRIALCDDIKNEHDNISAVIDEFFENANIRYAVDHFYSGETLISQFQDDDVIYDLILLDIFMTGINGYETATKLRSMGSKTPLAFLTTSRDFAIESYDVEAIGYLLKPLQKDKLFLLLAKLTRTQAPKCLSLKKRGHTLHFDFRDITFLESHGHTITVHLSDGQEESMYYKLDEIEESLDARFLRCHKSYIVNMDYVKYAESDFTLSTGESVPIRAHSRKELVNKYTNYFIEKHIGGDIR